MKRKIFVYGIFVVILALVFTTCSGSGGGGKKLNSAEDLKAYIDNQPANNPDKPIKVSMILNEQMIPNIVEVIRSADKYVGLSISGNLLTAIPESAFQNCKNLAAITIPKGVISISDSAFYGCSDLNTITIPTSVTSIGKRAFSGRTGLTSVVIPASVTFIGEQAFYGCSSLIDVTFKAGSNIEDANFGSDAFPVDSRWRNNTLKAAYSTGKAGTYKAGMYIAANGWYAQMWKKQWDGEFK